MAAAEPAAVFIDTTFLLPFFQVEVKVEAFSLLRFEEWLRERDQIDVSELSVYEVKAKLHRLSRRNPAYAPALQTFGENLATLRADDQFRFHPYSRLADEYFNLLVRLRPAADAFDAIIVAQAVETGFLLTEDREILRLRTIDAVSRHPQLRKLQIKSWHETVRTA